MPGKGQVHVSKANVCYGCSVSGPGMAVTCLVNAAGAPGVRVDVPLLVGTLLGAPQQRGLGADERHQLGVRALTR
jgi:hypothetical protein